MPIPQLTYKNVQKYTPQKRKSYYRRKKRKNLKLKFTAFLVKIFFLIFVVGLISFVGLFWWFSKDLPSADKLIERDIALSTKIYDRSGEVVLYDIHGEQKRTMINLEDIPKYAVNATITAEDREFFSHHGFNLKGMVRAVLTNLWKADLYGQGGSTITQQLVKNAILSPHKTYARKIKELVLSYRIESKFSKEAILKMYLNEIPYGSTVYGIEAASQTFFGKPASDLTLAEATILAALPKAPTYYSPYGNHKDKLINRQYYILDAMVEEGYIIENEAEEAKNEELKFKHLAENIIAPHFVMYIKELLAEKYGEKFMEQGGLKVHTTLDLDKQKKAEEAIENGMENAKNFNAGNASLVAIDPKTGQILAMVGSKDYFDIENDGNFNVALAARQPGSSFKPFVYTALLEKGYTTETVLFDLVTNFKPKEVKGKDYIPHNYDGEEHGPVTIREALQGSLNIPAVKALYLAGVNNVLDLAEKLGFTTLGDRSRFGLSLVLGGGEVRLLEHTAAYGVLAREGVMHPTNAILKIVNKENEIIEEYKNKEEVVLDAEIVRKINNILSDDAARSYVFGTGSKLTLKERPVCAKTGTTNDYKDAWTLGYTPSLVAGVWVGNNDNSEMKRGAGGNKLAAPIWNNFMTAALGDANDTPVEEFKKPKEDIEEKVMLNGQAFQEVKVKLDKFSGKLVNDFCPEDYIEEKSYNAVHSILYYIDKNNPRGDFPENPASDPQFEEWESTVMKWAETQEDINQERPPTEKCFLHNLENKPILKITHPNNRDTIKDDTITIRINATAPRGVHHVEYYIDNSLAKTISNYPFSLSYPSIKINNGFHTIKAKAIDDIGNFNETSIEINLMAERKPITFSWLKPNFNSYFYASSFPLAFSIQLSDRFNVQNIKIVYRKDYEQDIIVKSFGAAEITSDILEFKWGDNPTPGTYHFWAEAIDKQNRFSKGQELKIQVLK